MAGYKGHDSVTVYSACVLGPVCYWAIDRFAPVVQGSGFSPPPLMTSLFIVAAYLFSGLLLSNDLDISSRIYRRWGPFRIVWYPYQRLLPHRSMWSHGLFIGPVLRVVYLYVMLELVLLFALRITMLTGVSMPIVDAGLQLSSQLFPYLFTHPQIAVPLTVGLVLGGLSHSLLDGL